MINSDEAFGMMMEISNHPEYLKTAEKKSIATNTDYLSLEMGVRSIANRIGSQISENVFIVDSNRIKLLARSLMLGKVDGGESSLIYINSKVDDSKKISEYEIMMSRLRKIFAPDSLIFSEDASQELKNLYGDNPQLVESYIVKIAYALQLIYYHLINNKNYDKETANKLVKDIAEKIGTLFKKTTELVENVNSLIREATKAIPELPMEMRSDIDEFLDQYKEDEISKEAFIDNISNMAIVEKKNKFVR